MQLCIDDCLDPGFGYENKDGYVRILNRPRSVGGRLVMRHRWFWEVTVGPIAVGYEINHLCKNRRCCNVEHLECISISEHRSKDNAQRYYQNYQYFREYYLNLKEEDIPTQKEMGLMFNRTQTGIWGWIRRVEEELR